MIIITNICYSVLDLCISSLGLYNNSYVVAIISIF